MAAAESSLPSGLSSFDGLDSLVSSLASTTLVHLGLVGFLGLHGLLLAILDLLSGDNGGLVTVIGGLGLAATDVLDGHANDGLLDASGLARALLLNIVNLNLLVIGSPRGGPRELNGLLLLEEEAACLRRDEVVNSAVLASITRTAARHDLVIRE